MTKLFTGLLQQTFKEGTGSFVSGGPFGPEGEARKDPGNVAAKGCGGGILFVVKNPVLAQFLRSIY